MLLQSLRALCFTPGGPGRIWNYLGALVRFTGVSGRFACGFRTDLHCADVGLSPALAGLLSALPGGPSLVVSTPSLVADAPRCSQVHLRATAWVQSTQGFDHPGILVRQLSDTPRGSQ
jgi:hypothetical protein